MIYLKPNTVIEPLFARWYAWAHLISPATAAMNITGRHLKIMNSYIQAPQIHSTAIKSPKMLGGPFMDYKGERVDDIKVLRDQTLEKQKDLIEFSDAVKELDKMLKANANGYSLEPLYKQVPEVLKGYVELVYDLNNNPSFRFFETLLYKSKFFNPSFQSIAIWLTNNDERPFVLSTPKLDDEMVLHLEVPFSDSIIDYLSKMKRHAKPHQEVKQRLKLSEQQEALFETFFTETPPPRYRKYDGEKVRMRYFGHAAILVESKDVSILIDPVISYYGYHSDVSRFSDMDLPEVIDYVLITHNHQDHVLLETLLALRHKIKNIVVPRTTCGALQDPSLKYMLESVGFTNILEIGEMESLNFADCNIIGVPFIGEHCDLNIQAKICHHVKIGKFSMLFVADSCNVEPRLYEHTQKVIGDVDVIFLGMECDGAPLTWLYGPLLSDNLSRDKDGSRRLAGSNYEKGIALVDVFNPKEVYVYAMGQEPWLEFISSIKYTPESNPIIASNELIKVCNEKGIISERLFGEKELFYTKEGYNQENYKIEDALTTEEV
jgi:L-ascorbate metabolism protein UlaG (beta-lactamase superfamily)